MKICTEKTRRNFFYCLPVVHSLARLILFCLFTFSIPLAAGQFNRSVWLEGEYTCTFISLYNCIFQNNTYAGSCTESEVDWIKVNILWLFIIGWKVSLIEIKPASEVK